MSLFKKLSDAAKSTANTIGSKSAELVETGKLMMEKKQLEGKVRDLLTEAGGLYYHAHVEEVAPDLETIHNIFAEVKVLKRHVDEIEEKMHDDDKPTAEEQGVT